VEAAGGPVAPSLLRPRSAPQLFDAIFQITRAHAWDLFALSLIFHAPVHVFRLIGAFAGPRSSLQAWLPEPRFGQIWWLTWNSLAVTACAVATCQVYRDGRTNVARALEEMRALGWQLLGTVVAFELLVDGLWVIANGPGVSAFFAGLAFATALPWCAPAIPAAVVERVAPWIAMRRALELVRRNYWRVAMCIWIVWTVTWFADDELVSLVSSFSDKPAVPGVTDFAVDGALYALRGIAIAVVYFDCRVRREGYDVQHLLETTPA
jgi:hypothetical protein